LRHKSRNRRVGAPLRNCSALMNMTQDTGSS